MQGGTTSLTSSGRAREGPEPEGRIRGSAEWVKSRVHLPGYQENAMAAASEERGRWEILSVLVVLLAVEIFYMRNGGEIFDGPLRVRIFLDVVDGRRS